MYQFIPMGEVRRHAPPSLCRWHYGRADIRIHDPSGLTPDVGPKLNVRRPSIYEDSESTSFTISELLIIFIVELVEFVGNDAHNIY